MKYIYIDICGYNFFIDQGPTRITRKISRIKMVIIEPTKNIRWKFSCQSKVSFWKDKSTSPQNARKPGGPREALWGVAEGQTTECGTSHPSCPGEFQRPRDKPSILPMAVKMQEKGKSARVRRPRPRPASILPCWANICSLFGFSVPVSSSVKWGNTQHHDVTLRIE